MRCLLIALALSLVSLVATAQADDLAKMQGSWVVERVEADGKPVEQLRGTRATISGDKITVTSGQTEAVSKLELRENEKPKQLDSTDNAGTTTVGIYMIAGDTLQICVALPVAGAKRPSDFTTREADGRMLFIYKRAK